MSFFEFGEYSKMNSASKKTVVVSGGIFMLWLALGACDSAPAPQEAPAPAASPTQDYYGGYTSPTPQATPTPGYTASPAPTDMASISLQGTWYIYGKTCSIQQSGTTLTFVNENGEQATGSITSMTSIISNTWNSLTATLSSDYKTISWANNTTWTR